MTGLELSLEFDKLYIKNKKLYINYNISSFFFGEKEPSQKDFETKINSYILQDEKTFLKVKNSSRKNVVFEFDPQIWLKKTLSEKIVNTPDRCEKKIKIGKLPSLVENNSNTVILDQIVNGTFRNFLNNDKKLKNKILNSMTEINEPSISYFSFKYDGVSNSIIISLKPEFRINPMLFLKKEPKKEIKKMNFDKSVHTFISMYKKM